LAFMLAPFVQVNEKIEMKPGKGPCVAQRPRKENALLNVAGGISLPIS